MKRPNRFKIQRQLNIELPGFGDKKAKGPLSKRPSAPGMHSTGKFRKKVSEYGLRLREKQKIRFHYYVKEKQLINTIKKAKRKESDWMIAFAQMMETRLDNILFRMGIAPSIRSARQIIVHGHVNVNDKKCTSPSKLLKLGEKVSLKDKYYENTLVAQTLKEPTLELPKYISVEKKDNKVIGSLAELPTKGDIPFEFNQQYFIEFYGHIKSR